MSLVEQMLNMMRIVLRSCVLPRLVIQTFKNEKEKFELDTVSKRKLMEPIKNAG